MAKRRKTPEEKEEEIFKEPEFDVREFLKSEIKKGKGITILFLLSVGVGFLSAYLQVYVDIFLAVFIGFILLFAIKPILSFFNAEFHGRNTWIYAIFAFLLIWLSIWSVALNPPFNDLTPPQIKEVLVEYSNGTTLVIYSYFHGITNKNIDWKNVTKIKAKVFDNVKVSSVQINGKMADLENGYYVVNVSNINSINIVAYDEKGLNTEFAYP